MVTPDMLREIDLFRTLSPADLELLVPIAREEALHKDQVLFRERDPGDRLFVVLTGVIEIGRTGAGDGRRVRLARLERGEMFGELSMFDEGPRSASAVAVIVPESRVVSWSFADLFALFEKHPAVGLKIMKAMSKKLSVRLRATTDGLYSLLRELHRGAI